MNHHNFMDWQERRNKQYKMAQWKPEEKTKGYNITTAPIYDTEHSKVYGNHEPSEQATFGDYDDGIELDPTWNIPEKTETDPKVQNNPSIALTVPNKQHVVMHQILHELHNIHNGILPPNSEASLILHQDDPELQYSPVKRTSSTPTLTTSEPGMAYVNFDKSMKTPGDLIGGLAGSFGAFLLHHLIHKNPLEAHAAADSLEEEGKPIKDKVKVASHLKDKIDPALLKRYQTVVGHHVGVLEDYLRKKLASKKPYSFDEHLSQSGHRDLRGIMKQLLQGTQSGQAGK